jgi:DNA-binding Xre family transcriptional regulator
MCSVEPLDRFENKTLSALCQFFECEVGDILEYIPDDGAADGR